jgi:hypothetical protein
VEREGLKAQGSSKDPNDHTSYYLISHTILYNTDETISCMLMLSYKWTV